MFFSLRHVLLGIHLRELGMLQDGLAHAHHGIRGRQGEDGVAKLCEKTETVRDFLRFSFCRHLVYGIHFTEVAPVEDAQANILAP